MMYTLKEGLFLLMCMILICACATVQTKKEKPKLNGIFIEGSVVTKEETYAKIKGTVARLRAILSGKFVQYIPSKDTIGPKYVVWLTEDKQDSAVYYRIPAGDPNKVGYWTYDYQCLTSLPDEPIYNTFSKLTAINRDTIIAESYDVPEDFEVPIVELLKDPEMAFDGIDWSALKPSGSTIRYARKTPIRFIGESDFDDFGDEKIKFVTQYFQVNCDKIVVGLSAYDAEKKYLKSGRGDWLRKIAAIQSELLN